MANTFLNRVSAERRVLAVVNAQLPSRKRLTGLSGAAIDRWRAIIGLTRESSVNTVLLTLAELCQRLSDRSNETFAPLEQEETEAIERQLVVLKLQLNWFLEEQKIPQG